MDILKIFQFKIGQNNIQNRVYKKRKKIELNKGANWNTDNFGNSIFFSSKTVTIIFKEFYHKNKL